MTVARYPGATWRPVPRTFARATARNRVSLHTAVSNTRSLFDDFADGGPCSHFYVAQDGTVEQYIDTDFWSAADLEGNDATISIETWDGYPSGAPGYWRDGSDVPPWNPAQVASLRKLVAWILDTHAIPRQLAADAKPGPSSRGLAWHRLGVDGNFPELPDQRAGRLQRGGGMYWSTARGKACPGDRRIAQIPSILQEDDMTFDDADRQRLIDIRTTQLEDSKTFREYVVPAIRDIQYRVASMHANGYLPVKEGAPGGSLAWLDEKLAALPQQDAEAVAAALLPGVVPPLVEALPTVFTGGTFVTTTESAATFIPTADQT